MRSSKSTFFLALVVSTAMPKNILEVLFLYKKREGRYKMGT